MSNLKYESIHCLACNYEGPAMRGSRPVSKTPYGLAILIFFVLGIFFTPAFIVVFGLFVAAFFAWVFRLYGPAPRICPKCKTGVRISAEDWHLQND